MKVYILERAREEEYVIQGVFASAKAAMEVATPKPRRGWLEGVYDGGHYWSSDRGGYSHCLITEYEVQGEASTHATMRVSSGAYVTVPPDMCGCDECRKTR
jgi:hypothetical protein